MSVRTFPATAAQLQNLAVYLKGHGIVFDPTQPSGEAKAAKWDIGWQIAPGSVTVTVLSHPFAEEGIFWSRLQGMLQT